MTTIKHPEVNVQLSEEDGNAFMILERVKSAMKKSGVNEDECKEFMDDATSEDYDHLLQTCAKWVTVD